jgi:mRNA interferase MazF
MTEPDIRRGDIWWVGLDPAQGAEIKKTRPCLVLTHDTLNRLRRTVVVVPLSTAAKPHPPIAVPVSCQGEPAVAVVDQIRAVAKHRLRSRVETLASDELAEVCQAVATVLELR